MLGAHTLALRGPELVFVLVRIERVGTQENKCETDKLDKNQLNLASDFLTSVLFFFQWYWDLNSGPTP
jgi:hypothetical protein